MKKFLSIVIVLSMLFAFASCDSGSGNSSVENKKNKQNVSAEDLDLDLTKLSSTMVYSEVYNMMNTPDDYIGKKVKMQGAFSVYEGEERNYYACIIADATACCQQGMEFVRKGEHKYPEDYPELGDDITVTGVFETYYEGETRFCQLNNCEVVF